MPPPAAPQNSLSWRTPPAYPSHPIHSKISKILYRDLNYPLNPLIDISKVDISYDHQMAYCTQINFKTQLFLAANPEFRGKTTIMFGVDEERNEDPTVRLYVTFNYI
jgi:hypothetical protein